MLLELQSSFQTSYAFFKKKDFSKKVGKISVYTVSLFQKALIYTCLKWQYDIRCLTVSSAWCT